MKHWAAAMIVLASAGSAFAQDSWDSTRTQMPGTRWGHASAGAGGYLYVFAGTEASGNFLHVNRRYSPVTDSWTSLTAIYDYDGTGVILNPGWESPAGASYNGRIYQFCGTVKWNSVTIGDNSAYEYDPASDRWTRLTSVPLMISSAQAVEMGGKIYIAGSAWSGGPGIALFEFDPVARTYSRKPDLTGERYGYFFGGFNGKVFLAGGEDAVGTLDTVHEFDVTADTWSLKAGRMPAPASYGASACAKGKFFVIGGLPSPFTAVHGYDPIADSWRTYASAPVGLAMGSAATVSAPGYTRIHFTGGFDMVTFGISRGHFVYSPPPLPKPSDPTGLFMRTPGGDALPHGAFTGPNLVAGAQLADGSGAQVALQIEVAALGAAFTGNPTHSTKLAAPGEASVQVSVGGGSFKWRARCLNSNEEFNPGGWIDFGPSDPDFTVDNTPPTAPIPAGPVDTTVKTGSLDPTPVDFTWIEAADASPDPLTYEIQVSTDPTFARVDRVGVATGSTGQVHVNWSASPLYWRLRAGDSFGNEGPWSATASFMLVYEEGASGSDRNGPCSAGASSNPIGLALAAIIAALILLHRMK